MLAPKTEMYAKVHWKSFNKSKKNLGRDDRIITICKKNTKNINIHFGLILKQHWQASIRLQFLLESKNNKSNTYYTFTADDKSESIWRNYEKLFYYFYNIFSILNITDKNSKHRKLNNISTFKFLAQ